MPTKWKIQGRCFQTRTQSQTAFQGGGCVFSWTAGADLGGGCRGRDDLTEMTCGFLIQLVFCEKKTMWFIGVEVEQETSAPPPKKNPGSAPGL